MAEPNPNLEIERVLTGGLEPNREDLAFKPPTDPLNGIDPRAQAKIVYRDVPIVTVNTGWTPPLIRGAFLDLVAGIFDPVSQLIDTMTGDSRVWSGLVSRVGGLLGRPVDFLVPSKHRDSAAAQECHDAFVDAWPTMAAEAFLSELQTWAIMLGHGHGTLLWDTSGEYAVPHPRVWHPRYTYYHWQYRKIIAITQDAQVPITGGDSLWILHAPHGEYRGWMRGAVRATAPWWLARNYALRDAARWSEINGLPMIKAKHPASADRTMVEGFRNSLANLGGQTCVDLPQNVPEGSGNNGNFDVEYLEAAGVGFEGFFKLIDACDREITLTLLAQTLTSSVGPEGRGSYAAARVHADVRQALVEADARALERTIYTQLARPFARMNFGDPDLAPAVRWDVSPYEDAATQAETMLKITQALVNMKNAGFTLDPEDVARMSKRFGLDLGRLRVAPVMAEPTKTRIAPDVAARVSDAVAAMGGRSVAEIEREDDAIAEHHEASRRAASGRRLVTR